MLIFSHKDFFEKSQIDFEKKLNELENFFQKLKIEFIYKINFNEKFFWIQANNPKNNFKEIILNILNQIKIVNKNFPAHITKETLKLCSKFRKNSSKTILPIELLIEQGMKYLNLNELEIKSQIEVLISCGEFVRLGKNKSEFICIDPMWLTQEVLCLFIGPDLCSSNEKINYNPKPILTRKEIDFKLERILNKISNFNDLIIEFLKDQLLCYELMDFTKNEIRYFFLVYFKFSFSIK